MNSNLYIHVPFCAVKCRYCAFHSDGAATAAAMAAYPALALRELALRQCEYHLPTRTPWRTVYFGGGTPSLLGAERIAEILRSLPLARNAEITVECNPGDVTPAFAEGLVRAGVTRASVGVQSFSNRALAWLGRRHDAATARAAVRALRAAGVPRISLDLIGALPGAPAGEQENSLREAIALEPDHISYYPLSVEEGTPFAKAGVVAADSETWLASVACAEGMLAEAGYERYEISNYARGGMEVAGCRHNLAVWRGEDYLGIGPAAASRVGLERRINAPDNAAWAAALARGELPPPSELFRLTPADVESDRAFTRVRLSRWDGPNPLTRAGAARLRAIARLVRLGMVHARGDNTWSLTPRGREVSDSVMEEMC